MSAISSLSTAVTALRKNPSILVVALLFVLLSQLSIYLEAFVGPSAQFLVLPITILGMPFLLGGFITMIDEGLDGSTRFESFVRGGKENYLSMLGATVLFGVILFGVSVAVMFVLIFAGVGAIAAGSGGGGLGIMLVGTVIAVLIVAAVYMVFQFYHAAIVVSGVGATDSLSRSAGLVRRHLVSVVGFTVIYSGILLLGQGPGMALYFSAIEVTETGQTAVAAGSTLYLSTAVMLVLGTPAVAYGYAYLVAYYRSLTERDPTAVPAN